MIRRFALPSSTLCCRNAKSAAVAFQLLSSYSSSLANNNSQEQISKRHCSSSSSSVGRSSFGQIRGGAGNRQTSAVSSSSDYSPSEYASGSDYSLETQADIDRAKAQFETLKHKVQEMEDAATVEAEQDTTTTTKTTTTDSKVDSDPFVQNQAQKLSEDGKVLGADGSVDGNKPLWPECDTVEEIMDELKYGETDEGGAPPEVQPLHVLLALKAFLWGTVFAFVGVGAIAFASMKYFGFKDVKAVLEYVGSKDQREMEEMKKEGKEVVVFNMDLTKPSEVPQQFSELWDKIIDLSGVKLDEDDENSEKNDAAAGKKEKPTTNTA